MSLVGFKSSNHPQQVSKRGASDRDNLGTDPKLFAELSRNLGGANNHLLSGRTAPVVPLPTVDRMSR